MVVIASASGNQLSSFASTCPDVTNVGGQMTLSSDMNTLTVSYIETDGTGTSYSCTSTMIRQ